MAGTTTTSPPTAAVARRRPLPGRLVPGLRAGQAAVFGLSLLLWARGVRARVVAEGGLLVSQDGVWYLERAERFAGGDYLWHGVTTGERTHFPPGYPALLRLLDAVPGLSQFRGVLLLNAVCVLALAVALARIVVRLDAHRLGSARVGDEGGARAETGGGGQAEVGVGRSGRWPAGLGTPRGLLLAAIAGSFLCSPRVVDYTAAPLTELVFYACWAWSLALLLDPGALRSRRVLAGLVALGALALLDRYLAASLVAAVGVWLVVAVHPLRDGLRRGAIYLACAAAPLVVWSQLLGGIRQQRQAGVLDRADAVWDSLAMFGGVLLHLQAGRVGGVTGRAYVRFPFGADELGLRLAVALAAVVLVVAAVAVWQRTGGLRRLDATDPALLLAVTTAVFVSQPLLFRLRIRHLFLDRYWGLACTLLLLVAASRPGAGRLERALWWVVVVGAGAWSLHRYGSDLPAIRTTFKS